MSELILASASPRRAEILQQIGVDFQIEPADIDETPRLQESPVDYVKRMAQQKAQHVIDSIAGSSSVVLGADTSVVLGCKIYGKPKNQQEAMAMLAALSGKTHQVLTAVALGNKQRCVLKLSATDVKFRELDPKECLDYWNTGEPLDKAGSYAIQGLGAVFVEKISGSFSGVVGLPIEQTAQLLRTFNVPIWGAAHKKNNFL
jgi:septum formation protein